MMTTQIGGGTKANDAELVAESLAGSREAFRQIVERHQTLVCSLGYCATGSLTQSEDLAQETFLAAWRQLPELREPSKLRPWLCGIARFVIGKELRRQGREPVHAAETLERVNELAGPEPLPSERVMSKEEQAILWHCVARIPEIYREPLVLFYREHQSIERVAEALELSEDAVKQRLARGRKLLQEQALAYVEGALQSTNPGRAFTAGVLAALPLSATTAKAATAGAAIKGSSTAKALTGLAALGTIVLFNSFVAFLAFLGACAGYGMSRACATSSRQCENVIRFWRTVAVGFTVCLAGWLLVQPLLLSLDLVRHVTLAQFGGGKLWLDLFCTAVLAALALWMRRWWRDLSCQEAERREHGRLPRKRIFVWLSLGIIGPACLSGVFLWGMLWQTLGSRSEKRLSDAEVQNVITERKDARFCVWRGWDGSKTLHIALPEDRGRFSLRAAANDSTLKLLNRNSVDYTAVRVASCEAWPFGWLLAFFIAPMGAVVLLRQIGKGQWKTASPAIAKTLEQDHSKYGRMLLELRTDPRAGRVFCIAFATVFLLVCSANAFTGVGLYVVLFVGSVKGAFLGLVGGVGVLYLRTQRKVSKTGVKI